jgi:alginate O-acetyltransferase complex protein AlgI
VTTTTLQTIDEPSLVTPAFKTLLLADWRDVTFIHFAIDPALLQPHVPFDLDLYAGQAWVSLVTFTQAQLRPAIGGALTAWTMRPVATHPFLNLRTYVRAHGDRAIYFLAEWIPNPLSRLAGPRLYGLPFRLARLAYEDNHRLVTARRETFDLQIGETSERQYPAQQQTLDHFLLERYTAFTCRHGRGRMFQIRHQPWPMTPAQVTIKDDTLIRRAAPWFANAHFICAHASPGVFDVEMSAPRIVPTTRRAHGARDHASLLPLIVLPALALIGRDLLPPWGFMWALAFAIYFACKWSTWRTAPKAGWRRSLGYLLAWPGMNAKAFLGPLAPAIPAVNLSAAIARTIIGATLFFGIARLIPAPFLTGWTGLLGLVLFLHFGLFDLLAFAWQSADVRAEPIMRAPLLARSLGEFWGARWNRAFRDLVHPGIFIPLLKPLGPARATLAVFLVSGLVHDLVISLPAGAGFGLPTLYFLLQGGGILIEKSRWGRCHLRGRAGRMFAIAVAAVPAPILFHPPFVARVILPFMRAVGCF